MRWASAPIRGRLALLAVLLVGYVLGWRVPDLWPELEAETGYPRSWAAGSVAAPLHHLERIGAGELSPAAEPDIAAALERTLDGLIGALHRTGPATRSVEVPESTRRDVVALVAAYRRVFPTFGRDREPIAPILAHAAEPSPALLERARAALVAALTARRTESAAMWAALQGRAAPPPVKVSRRREDLVLRIDERGIAGRLRVYGDGRLVTTGRGPEPVEEVRALGVARLEALASALAAGGFLAPDRLEEWRASGAPGCPWLAPRPRFVRELAARAPAPTMVTLALERVGPLPGSTSPALEAVVRRMRVPDALLAESCRPADATVHRLRAALLALRSLDGEELAAWPAPETAQPPARRVRRLPPGGSAVLFSARGEGLLVTDGRRCGAISRAEPFGVSVAPAGDLVAFSRGGGLWLLDRAAGAAARRLTPPGARGGAALWSPAGDRLLIAHAPAQGWTRMYLADRRGRRSVPFGEEGASPLAWTAEGRGVYYRLRTGRSGAALRFTDLAGRAVDVDLPGEPRSVQDLAPSPDGRHLAYRASHLIAGQPALSIFTVPLDPGTALPRPGAPAVLVAEKGGAFDWAPDGRSIVYVVPGRRGIHEVGADGRDDRRLAGSEFGECDYDAPAISPDGESLLFLRCTSRGIAGHLFLAHRDGSGAWRVGRGGHPRWLPAGAPWPPLDRRCPG